MQQEKFKNLFAKNLSFLMGEYGVTQEELADGLGVSQAAISRYLKGRIPKAEILFDLITHFPDVEMEGILFRDLALGPGMKSKRLPAPKKAKIRPTVARLNHRLNCLSDEDAERVAKVCLSFLDTLENPLKRGPGVPD